MFDSLKLAHTHCLSLLQKHRGITAFMIEKDTPGLEVGMKEDKVCLCLGTVKCVVFYFLLLS